MTRFNSKSTFRLEATLKQDGQKIDLSNADVTVLITSEDGGGEEFARFTLSDAELSVVDTNGEAVLKLDADAVDFPQTKVFFEFRVDTPASSVVPVQTPVSFDDVSSSPS